jgi:hypothetical protein
MALDDEAVGGRQRGEIDVREACRFAEYDIGLPAGAAIAARRRSDHPAVAIDIARRGDAEARRSPAVALDLKPAAGASAVRSILAKPLAPNRTVFAGVGAIVAKCAPMMRSSKRHVDVAGRGHAEPADRRHRRPG